MSTDTPEDRRREAPDGPEDDVANGSAISGNDNDGGRIRARTRLDQIIDTCLIAGIIALVSATVLSLVAGAELKAAFTERNLYYDREIQRLDGITQRNGDRLDQHAQDIWRLDQRITEAERRQSAGQRDGELRQRR